MTYKQFINWCNGRACDGKWSMEAAIVCTDIIAKINKFHFWKREKEWQKINTEYNIVGLTNQTNLKQ